ncbi:MAG: VOC family protein, partial [Alphaproteobacteria bacterium]|nr:VOC family protein [Alphaproteobacteria bacterium]
MIGSRRGRGHDFLWADKWNTVGRGVAPTGPGARWRGQRQTGKERKMAKLRHIVFNTTDVDRLAQFYVDVFGME